MLLFKLFLGKRRLFELERFFIAGTQSNYGQQNETKSFDPW